jgi:hypothetical protein
MSVRRLYDSIRQLHEHPQLIAFAATTGGRILLWAAATLLLAPSRTVYLVSPLLALILIAPQWRVQILSVGSIFAFYRLLAPHALGPAAIIGFFASVTILLYVCYLAARSYARLPRPIQRNAQILLHLIGCLTLLSTWLLPDLIGVGVQDPVLEAARFLVPFLLWRCGYLLLSGRRGTAARTRFADHAFYCIPAYGGTAVPYGKGHDHLTRHRADEPLAQARAALAGVKLLILVWVWTALRLALALFVYGEDVRGLGSAAAPYALGVPRLGEVIASPGSVGLPLAWLSTILELVDVTLTYASWGHMVIGALRLFGYNVFRNTYKPLLARSLVDFWNRFYYYFKELMVEFFFFPTYISTFKTYPRLRIFAAILAAACLGNIYYHVLLDVESLVAVGFVDACRRVGPRAFYCLLLALGIFVSMLREQARRGAGAAAETTLPRALRQIAGVWLFYAVIHIWNVKPVGLTFTQRSTFFLSLFGL